MKTFLTALMMLVSVSSFAAESVIEGEIAKIVPSKSEIYVKGKEDGKKHEYYFNAETQVTREGQPAQFSDLKEGMQVRVTAEKKGKRLDPKKVEILK